MNALIVAFFATLALASAAPSGWGLGWGGWGGPLAGGALLGAPLGIAAPGLALGGVGVVTRGGGTIGIGPAGAAISGPPTAPVVIAGPSGVVRANGLWGPTLAGVAGHGW